MTSSPLLNYTLLTLACLLALAGLIFTLRALFADRSRGTPRCPRCWYDMSAATSLQCSECGRVATPTRRLHKTRRHWKRAILGILILVTGLAAASGQRFLEHGWIKATPNCGYILALPWAKPGGDAMKELERRVKNGEPESSCQSIPEVP
jgi:hypothetical protein